MKGEVISYHFLMLSVQKAPFGKAIICLTPYARYFLPWGRTNRAFFICNCFPFVSLVLRAQTLWSLLELGSQTQAIGNIERSFATASLVPLLLWSVHKLSGHYYSWALFCNCLRPCVILVLCSLLWLWSLLELGSQTRASLFLVTATGALALTNPEYTRPWIDNLTVIFMRYLAPSVSMP